MVNRTFKTPFVDKQGKIIREEPIHSSHWLRSHDYRRRKAQNVQVTRLIRFAQQKTVYAVMGNPHDFS